MALSHLLGLAIARQLANKNSWKIELKARSGGGTVAILELEQESGGAQRSQARNLYRLLRGGLMSFQIHALNPSQFAPLFALSDSELAKVRASRIIADAKPGYPCRVSLTDAEIGEIVILVNFEHQSGDSPYRSAHAIIVRENMEQAFPGVGEIPGVFETRIISIRAFDDRHNIVDADVVDGAGLGESVLAMLQDQRVANLHLHNAKMGCFLARVTRA